MNVYIHPAAYKFHHGIPVFYLSDITDSGAMFALKIYLNFKDGASSEMTGIHKFFFEYKMNLRYRLFLKAYL